VDGTARALACTSLIKLSRDPKTQLRMDYEGLRIVTTACRMIGEGEEVTIDYGGAPDARHVLASNKGF
jgi:SET domain-containing protein